MIHFARKPDALFTLILHEALEMSSDDIRAISKSLLADGWELSYPSSSRCFSAQLAAEVVDQLLALSKESAVYRITDYHYLLIHDCLQYFCATFNALAQEEPDGLLPLGEYKISEIVFEELVDVFFWDTDFLEDRAIVEGLGEKLRHEMGMTDNVFAIAQGWGPHTEDLRVELVERCSWHEDEPEELFRSGSTRYPDVSTEGW